MPKTSSVIAPYQQSPEERGLLPRRELRRRRMDRHITPGLFGAAYCATGNVSSLADIGATIDGHEIAGSEVLLLPFQTDKSENGIWLVGGDDEDWTRITLRPFDRIRVMGGEVWESVTWEVQDDGETMRVAEGWGYLAWGDDVTLPLARMIVGLNAGTAKTVSLPAGVRGLEYIIKRLGVDTVTVDAAGSETIDGAGTYDLTAQYAFVRIWHDGTNWHTT